MPNLTSDTPIGFSAQLFASSTTQQHKLGTRAVTADGRVFRYVLAGAADLVVGNMIQAPAQIANHQQLTPSAAAIGATSIVATLGATAATAGQYADGFAIIDTTPGLGYAYPILGHAAVASAGVITLTLPADSPIQVALTTSSRVSLQANPYSGVIQTPVTTLTGACVGCAVYPIPATQYGWIQTKGPCSVLVAGTPGVGLAVVVPGTAAGCVVIDSAAAATPIVGSMMVTGVDGKCQAVFLNIN
jgi:hypothetical protein